MIYRVLRTVLKQKKDPGLYEYLDHHMHLSNNLYNATLFRIRQNFTSRKKDIRQRMSWKYSVRSKKH